MARFRTGKDAKNSEVGFRVVKVKEDIKIERYDDYEIFEDKNEKLFSKYVKQIKVAMRKSYEYKELMKFLKIEGGLDHCGVHPNISMDNGFTIEIHHSPFYAEQIIVTVLRKRQALNESISLTDVVEELMQLHYQKIIGLYPLDDMCHEYHHNEENTLFIPNYLVFGNPDLFVEAYQDYMPDALLLKWENSQVLSDTYKFMEKNIPADLMRENVYVTNEAGEYFMSIQRMIQYLEDLGVTKK